MAKKKWLWLFCLFTIFLLSTNPILAGNKHLPKKKFDETKIEKYKTKVLLEYLTSASLIWQSDKYSLDAMEMQYRIKDELVRRKQVAPLIKAFESPADEEQQLFLAQALCDMDDYRIELVFKKFISTATTHTMYYCLKYLAKRGDREALQILNDNHCAYPEPSYELAEVVRYFGQYKYEPSIPLLIDALDAVSLNLVDAAQKSLEQFFEGPYPDWKTIEEMKNYFQKRYEDSRNK